MVRQRMQDSQGMTGTMTPMMDSVPFRKESSLEFVALAGLVSRATVFELDERMLQCLRHPSLRDTLSEMDIDFGEWISQSDQVVFDEAAEDYAKLFVLPDGPTSRLSLHVPGERTTLGLRLGHTIRQACSELGFVSIEQPPWGNMPEDHVGLVFEVLARAASVADSDGLASRWIARINREVLELAIPSWSTGVLLHARTPFYRCIAELSLACVSCFGGA